MTVINGEKLRLWRQRRLLTLRDLSAESGVAYDTIHAIEHGKQSPRPSTVKRLALALGIAPEELMDWDDPADTKKAVA